MSNVVCVNTNDQWWISLSIAASSSLQLESSAFPAKRKKYQSQSEMSYK